MPEPLVFTDTDKMRAQSREWLRAGKTIGFVPTMGALHAAHRMLIERARQDNDIVVVSIYVNPTQFGPGEDFEKYPRTFDADAKICADAGADAILHPENLSDPDHRTVVSVGGLDEHLCGLSRPGHFRGVTTVVAKLFNIVLPTRAYFGRKDAQQLLIIQTMVRDLDLGIGIVPCEILREADGLAMSSRNRYLSPAERKKALCLSRALSLFKTRVKEGETDAMEVLGEMAEILTEDPDVELDYVAIVDAHNLEDLKTIEGDVLAAIAVKIGKTRLIDNARISV
jgi:pantoate--beta-alanine ligase